MLYVILCPTGPYFRSGPKPISLLAVDEYARSWPGGTGGHKLGLNYAPGFMPQRAASKKGYDQVLWLLGPEKIITEAGAMNIFIVLKRDDGGAPFIYVVLSTLPTQDTIC
jgi:branched-chain amino acid aminotransferase